MSLELSISCSDCSAKVTIPITEGPTYFEYGQRAGKQSLRAFGLNSIPVPPEWDSGINQIRRCPSCSDAYRAKVNARIAQEDRERQGRLREKYAFLSVRDLVSCLRDLNRQWNGSHEEKEIIMAAIETRAGEA